MFILESGSLAVLAEVNLDFIPHIRPQKDLRLPAALEPALSLEGLVVTGLREGVTAQKALGYAQVLQMMDGLLTSDEAREETKRVTRQYIRRQDTWFSRDNRLHWLGHYENRLEKILTRINS